MSMDAAEVLNQLTHSEALPKAALQAASEQRAEIVPVFLREIDSFLTLTPAERAKPTPLFFIFHLFGDWREKAAYRPLARLLRCAGHEVDAVLGDAITSTTHRVMAAVFDGDPDPLYKIILDPHADHFVRSSMCETLAIMAAMFRLTQWIIALSPLAILAIMAYLFATQGLAAVLGLTKLIGLMYIGLA
jgi:uncharacterized protein